MTEPKRSAHRVRVLPPEGVKVDWYVSYGCACGRGAEHVSETASSHEEALGIAFRYQWRDVALRNHHKAGGRGT